MNIDQFKAEIAKYQKQLAQPIPTEMNLCIEKISQLGAIHYRTGYLLANAKRFLRKVKEEKTKDQIDKKKENKLEFQIRLRQLMARPEGTASIFFLDLYKYFI